MKVVFALFCATLSCGCYAESVDSPLIKSGDAWRYVITTEGGNTKWNQSHFENTVTRATSTSIYYQSKAVNSNQPAREVFTNLDWSVTRLVNGSLTVVNKPFAFPLTQGKAWEVAYTEQHPNKQFKFLHHKITYKVVGNEMVTVPAGKFNAIKIEAEGEWDGEVLPSTTVVQGIQSTSSNNAVVSQVNKVGAFTTTGRTYKAFWYVPETKAWVKSVEESYTSSGTLESRVTDELESFKSADQLTPTS